ncbi:MAG: thermonuclease family protein [Candidatus Binatia bacterium]
MVDGDTADLFVDTGFHGYHLFRFRFLDIDTPELNSSDEDKRAKAKDAKKFVQDLFDTFEKTTKIDLAYWPLRIETVKDPDNFGRWLARIFITTDFGESSVNAELIERGLAVPYEK